MHSFSMMAMTKLKSVIALLCVVFLTLFLTACQTLHLPNQQNTAKPLAKEHWAFIVYDKSQNRSHLMQSDTTGNHVQTLLSVTGKISGLNPSFDFSQLIYTLQDRSFPMLYRFDRQQNLPFLLVEKRANYFGASLSPDNQKLLFSATFADSPDIFIQDFDNGFSQKTEQNYTNLTENLSQKPAIDISPAWSPDGKSFVFVSDKNSNQPKLYHYHFDNQSSERIGKFGYEANVRYSPTGKMLTFFTQQKIQNKTVWQNMLMDLDSKATISVRDDALADFVNFSPTGDFLIYPFYQQIIVMTTPTITNGKFSPILQKNSFIIKGLPNNSVIKEVVWLKN